MLGIGDDGDIVVVVVIVTTFSMVAVLIEKNLFICMLDGCISGVSSGGGGNSGCGGSCLEQTRGNSNICFS